MTASLVRSLVQIIRFHCLTGVTFGLVIISLAGLACKPSPPQTALPEPTNPATSTGIPESPTTAAPSPTPTAAAEIKSVSAVTPLPTRDAPTSPLEQALALAPIGFAGSAVEFADYSGYLELQDTENTSLPEVWPYEGMRLHPALSGMVVNLRESLGIDLLASGFGVWAWEPGNISPKFLIYQGGFEDERVIRWLLDMGYVEADYSGTPYYALGGDFEWSIESPLGAAGVSLNRVGLASDWLMAAPSTALLERLADLQTGSAGESLWDSEPHRALVGAIDGRPLGGAFITPQWIMKQWNTVNPAPVERLDKYLAGPDRWGQVSSYSLAFIGYVIRENADEIVVALFYPEPGAAAADAYELEQRWHSFQYDPLGRGLIGAPEHDDLPLSASCTPFSTTVIQKPEHSILVGTCPVIRDEDNPSVKGPGLWSWLFSTRELQFLVPDLTELRK